MKAVLISIKPQWCEEIVSGERTIEFMKTKPNYNTPFKCYIYCMKNEDTKDLLDYHNHGEIIKMNGKVIGEFVCDKIDLENWEMAQYSDGELLYFWHISELRIYDKPRELSEYSFVCQYKECENCKYNVYEILPFAVISIGCDRRIDEAPQSWCYVEDGEQK